MLRAPLSEPEAEEWVHLSVGFVGKPILERKQTVLGNSELSTFGNPAGWVELRLVRSGPSVVLLHRLDGAGWTFTHSYAETRLPESVELLLTGQTAGLGVEPDLIGHVDWVRVQASPLSAATAAAVAAGTASPDAILAELPD